MHFRLLALAVLLGWSQAVFSAHDGREHIVPLFMAADNDRGRQGFLRVINHSSKAGTVQIYGVDDSGRQVGPIDLQLMARQTKHINSDDVENGNADKELSPGLGDGDGDWRLMLSSADIDIEPLAYIRTRTGFSGEGFLTSMHDVASEAGMRHRVPIFNPGSNPNQLSSLRVINLGDGTANITISGIDDGGEPGDADVTESIDVRGAYSATAVDLEGTLGDGRGKWSLVVTSDQPVQVMSLMDVPTGQLSNLSGAKREYRGAAGLWQVTFEDGMGGDGFIILLPDSRLYAWLPEDADTNQIARATYTSEAGIIEASGVLYESGDLPAEGFTIVGSPDDVEFSAMYQSGDWIRGSYEVAGGQARNFQGYAYTGFERGGATANLQGTWAPMGTDPDLPVEITPMPDGSFEGALDVEGPGGIELTCAFTATISPINPAFNVYEGDPVIDCDLLAFGGEANPDQVEMIMSVMDDPDMPGTIGRAVIFSILPLDEKVALGAIYER